MNAKSGNGSSKNFIWGVLAGLIALLGAGGVYLSGLLTPEPVEEPAGQDAEVAAPAESQTEPESVAQTAEPQAETDAEPEAEEPTEQANTEPSEPSATKPADHASAEVSEQGTTEQAETTAEDTAPAAGQTDTANSATAEAEADDIAPETTSAPAEEATAEAPASVAPPELDQIFVETDGNALLSGNAEPGSQVRVLLDGKPVHEFTVDNSGEFAEFVSIPFSDNAQGLVLETSDGEQAVQSDDYLIAALPKPVEEQVASAEETAEPAAAPEDSTSDDTKGASETETQPETETQTADAEVLEPATDEAEAVAEAQTAEADQQIAIFRSGEEGVELVQPPSAQNAAPDQVALDTIGYSESGDVQLTGRARQGSAVRLYLNNRLVADLEPTEDGNWRGDLAGVDPGVYTLRVDEVGTDGTVLSRVETPFQREPVEVLQAAESADTDTASEVAPPIRSVTVQKGDTLWAISRDRFGDGVLYVRLFEANRDLIRDPDLIYPGQVFSVPEE